MDTVDSSYVPPPGQAAIVDALKRGDEHTFSDLVTKYSPSMLRVARTYVSSRAVAEEVVQEAWLGVISGIGRFEGRASLKTWIFRIVTNIAKTRGEREGRSVPFSSVGGREGEGEAAVDPDRFLDADAGPATGRRRRAAGQSYPKSSSWEARQRASSRQQSPLFLKCSER